MPRPSASSRAALRFAAALFFLGSLGAPAVAEAAGNAKDAAAQKALTQALDDDYLNTRFDDAEQKLRGAIQACGKQCSAAMRAKLHVALGSVLAGGKKQLEDARDEFAEALTIDPKIEPNPDLLSTEVTFAYEQARRKLKLATGMAPLPPPPDPKPTKKPPKPETDEKDEPEEKPKPSKRPKEDKPEGEEKPVDPKPAEEPAKKNWITVSFAPDLAFVSGSDVCTLDNQASAHYVCLRPDGTRYQGEPTPGNGNNINAGLGIATLRLMLGYDRLVHPNLTLGVRLGFAFNGASGGGASFLPLHAEARFGIWPGHDPFVGKGVRPMIILSGGVAQVDVKVPVQVLEDGVKCGAKNPMDTSSLCTQKSNNVDDTVEKREQTLAAYRQNGLGFAAATLGVQFAPSTRVAFHLALRTSVTFPAITAVLSPEAGVSVGF